MQPSALNILQGYQQPQGLTLGGSITPGAYPANSNGLQIVGQPSNSSFQYDGGNGLSYQDPQQAAGTAQQPSPVLGASIDNTSPTGEVDQTPIDTYLLDQQINNANKQLGRIPGQLDTGLGNIQSTYDAANISLGNDLEAATGQYNTSKTQTGQDYTNSRAGIRQNAGQQQTALQRLLGAAGAGRSSAAQTLAPFAVGREAASRFGEVQDAFGRNQGALDTNFATTQTQFDDAEEDLNTQKTNQENTLRTGLDNAEIGLYDQLTGLGLQKNQLQGGGLADVQNTVTPYQTAVQKLLDQIDGYGKLAVNTPDQLTYAAPDLEQYDYSRFSRPELQAGNGAQDYVSPFVSLLQQGEEEQLRVQ